MTVLFSLCLLASQNLELSSYQQRMVCNYEHTIRKHARQNELDPALLTALIYVESSFYKSAVSSANACGLTQVVPYWTGGKETKGIKYTCEQLKHPETSIKVGAQILSYNIEVYAGGNVDKGLCMYNAGTVCIKKKGFYKRLGYVKKVNYIYSLLTSGR